MSSFGPALAKDEQEKKPGKIYPSLKPEPTILKLTGHARVVKIIDPLRLELDDKRIIRLVGLDIPDLFIDEPGDISLQAKNLLEDLFTDQKVNIYQSHNAKEGRINRMDHHLAHITRQEDDVWAQGALISEGLARARTTISNRELSQEMANLEQEARIKLITPEEAEEDTPKEHIGLWKEEAYQLLTPETVLDAPRKFQIVEGKILKTAIHKNRIYLNFGQNWKNDFTVSIGPKTRKLFSKEGYKPLSWSGKTIRVRGWIEEYNGPYIDLDHPERIEFIEDATDTNEPEATAPRKDPEDALPAPP